jgi:hypothetical protein
MVEMTFWVSEESEEELEEVLTPQPAMVRAMVSTAPVRMRIKFLLIVVLFMEISLSDQCQGEWIVEQSADSAGSVPGARLSSGGDQKG